MENLPRHEADNGHELPPELKQTFGRAALEAVKLTPELEKESAKERMKFFGNQYRKVRSEFRSEVLDKHADLTEDEFKPWEKRTKDSFRGMILTEAEAGLDKSADRYVRDRLEDIADTEHIDQTVEVYAANFYQERNDALLAAINSSPSELQEKHLETVYSLFENAILHLGDVENTALRAEDPERWSRECQFSHNRLIRNFNNINDLAVKYGTTPLTCRNFTTNDFEYNAAEDPGSYTSARAIYDRNIVEAYCEKAFPKLYHKTSRENSNSSKRREPTIYELLHMEGED